MNCLYLYANEAACLLFMHGMLMRDSLCRHFSLAKSLVQHFFFFSSQNIFIFYGCKVMFVLKATLESLISFSHELQELVQMG